MAPLPQVRTGLDNRVYTRGQDGGYYRLGEDNYLFLLDDEQRVFWQDSDFNYYMLDEEGSVLLRYRNSVVHPAADGFYYHHHQEQHPDEPPRFLFGVQGAVFQRTEENKWDFLPAYSRTTTQPLPSASGQLARPSRPPVWVTTARTAILQSRRALLSAVAASSALARTRSTSLSVGVTPNLSSVPTSAVVSSAPTALPSTTVSQSHTTTSGADPAVATPAAAATEAPVAPVSVTHSDSAGVRANASVPTSSASSSAVLTASATSATALAKQKRRGIKGNPALKQRATQARNHIKQQIRAMRVDFKISGAQARRLVSTGIGSIDVRHPSDWNKWRSWIASTGGVCSQKEGETLAAYQRRLAVVWLGYKTSPTDSQLTKDTKQTHYAAMMKTVNTWHRSRSVQMDAHRSKTAMSRIIKKLSTLINVAHDLHGISIVSFVAHHSGGVVPKVCARAHSRQLFAATLKSCRHDLSVSTVGQSFWGHCIANPPPAVTTAGIDNEVVQNAQPPIQAILQSLESKNNKVWPHQRTALANRLLDIMHSAVKEQAAAFLPTAADATEEALRVPLRAQWREWDKRCKQGTELPYGGLFDMLHAFGLEIRGWPTESESLLSTAGKAQAVYSSSRHDTLTITGGSLPNRNLWNRRPGRYLLAILTANSAALSCVPTASPTQPIGASNTGGRRAAGANAPASTAAPKKHSQLRGKGPGKKSRTTVDDEGDDDLEDQDDEDDEEDDGEGGEGGEGGDEDGDEDEAVNVDEEEDEDEDDDEDFVDDGEQDLGDDEDDDEDARSLFSADSQDDVPQCTRSKKKQKDSALPAWTKVLPELGNDDAGIASDDNYNGHSLDDEQRNEQARREAEFRAQRSAERRNPGEASG
ncbi:hypothetical protein CF328_g3286 [Tilletia controversa]|nr:hypothetical protein CF328_g3286 [Tilletia controversa]